MVRGPIISIRANCFLGTALNPQMEYGGTCDRSVESGGKLLSIREPRRILILTADAGFGHRSAANAIAAALDQRYADRA